MIQFIYVFFLETFDLVTLIILQNHAVLFSHIFERQKVVVAVLIAVLISSDL